MSDIKLNAEAKSFVPTIIKTNETKQNNFNQLTKNCQTNYPYQVTYQEANNNININNNGRSGYYINYNDQYNFHNNYGSNFKANISRNPRPSGIAQSGRRNYRGRKHNIKDSQRNRNTVMSPREHDQNSEYTAIVDNKENNYRPGPRMFDHKISKNAGHNGNTRDVRESGQITYEIPPRFSGQANNHRKPKAQRNPEFPTKLRKEEVLLAANKEQHFPAMETTITSPKSEKNFQAKIENYSEKVVTPKNSNKTVAKKTTPRKNQKQKLDPKEFNFYKLLDNNARNNSCDPREMYFIEKINQRLQNFSIEFRKCRFTPKLLDDKRNLDNLEQIKSMSNLPIIVGKKNSKNKKKSPKNLKNAECRVSNEYVFSIERDNEPVVWNFGKEMYFDYLEKREKQQAQDKPAFDENGFLIQVMHKIDLYMKNPENAESINENTENFTKTLTKDPIGLLNLNCSIENSIIKSIKNFIFTGVSVMEVIKFQRIHAPENEIEKSQTANFALSYELPESEKLPDFDDMDQDSSDFNEKEVAVWNDCIEKFDDGETPLYLTDQEQSKNPYKKIDGERYPETLINKMKLSKKYDPSPGIYVKNLSCVQDCYDEYVDHSFKLTENLMKKQKNFQQHMDYNKKFTKYFKADKRLYMKFIDEGDQAEEDLANVIKGVKKLLKKEDFENSLPRQTFDREDVLWDLDGLTELLELSPQEMVKKGMVKK